MNFKTTQPCQQIATTCRPFLKGSFLAKGLLFLMNHVTNERKRNVSERVPIGLACYTDLASSEATINEVSRGCTKMEKGERREVERKFFLRPFLKRKEVRVGLWSPSSFVVPGTICRARVRMVWPRPSAAKSIGKRSLSCVHPRVHENKSRQLLVVLL